MVGSVPKLNAPSAAPDQLRKKKEVAVVAMGCWCFLIQKKDFGVPVTVMISKVFYRRRQGWKLKPKRRHRCALVIARGNDYIVNYFILLFSFFLNKKIAVFSF